MLMRTLQAVESNEIYAHMDAEHGGSGADVHELMAEMENDPFIREFIERQHPALLVGFAKVSPVGHYDLFGGIILT